MKDIHYITDIESLKAISDSLRISILLSLKDGPMSGQDIAKAIDINRSKIHYHLKELESHGFIEVAKTEVKNGIIQKFYLPVAKAFIPDISIFNNHFFAGYKEIFVEAENVANFKNEMNDLINKYDVAASTTTEKITLYIGE